MKEYILNTAQPGFAVGEAFRIGPCSESAAGTTLSPETELARLDKAVSTLRDRLSSAAADGAGDNAAIFEAQRFFLDEKDFIEAARTRIKKESIPAGTAVKEAGEALARRLEEGESAYIRERSADVRGLADRLVETMSGSAGKTLQRPSILVAKELSPAGIAALDHTLIRGFVTVKGSPTSHVSVLAENWGIPYLYGAEEAVGKIADGDKLILDEGRLICGPDEETLRNALARADAEEEKMKQKQAFPPSSRKTVCRTKICANISGPQDIEDLLASGADGVGLFRSELLFLDRESEPTEEEQYRAYRRVTAAMGERETVIRTMDLGSDKQAGWLDLPAEKNPALGLRGLRISLEKPRLLHTQLRALLRAAACGRLKVMIPMVTAVWEVEAVRAEAEACAGELETEGIPFRMPPLGIMVETPAAAMTADELAECSDFFSIGTNDLTQYTLALDREAQGLDRYYDPCHEAVMRLIAKTAEAGHKRHLPVAVCGELAGNPSAVRRLIEAGVDELSVSVKKVGQIREAAFRAEQEIAEAQKRRPAVSFAAAPADGRLVPMENIPDPAFSSGSLGKCAGILPENGTVYAPCDGTVTAVAAACHAITFAAEDGRSILVHAGIDTVRLEGKGFTPLVKEGDTVRTGQEVLRMDLETIRAAGLSPMVITCLLPENP